MIGFVLLLSVVAGVVALIKRGRLWKLVLVFAVFSALTLFITNHYVTTCGDDFCGIGQALIGSCVAFGFALVAAVCAFWPKRIK